MFIVYASLDSVSAVILKPATFSSASALYKCFNLFLFLLSRPVPSSEELYPITPNKFDTKGFASPSLTSFEPNSSSPLITLAYVTLF